MDISLVWKAIIALAGLCLVFGVVLAIAYRRLAVKVDPRVEEILEVLPGSNCGACGYPGCEAAATAVVEEKAPPDVCLVGGMDVLEAVGEVLGVDVGKRERPVAMVRCRGGVRESVPTARYMGVDSCLAADLVAGGGKACKYGCLGLGTCREVCPRNAITLDDDGRVIVDRDRCSGCALCIEVCPKDLITLVPRNQKVVVACNSPDKGARAKKTCSVCCIGCRKCEKVCKTDAIVTEDSLARIDYGKCIDCGKCIEVCPTDCIIKVKPARRVTRKGIDVYSPAASGSWWTRE